MMSKKVKSEGKKIGLLPIASIYAIALSFYV